MAETNSSLIKISPVKKEQYHDLSQMVGELLTEIMDAIQVNAFNYDEKSTEKRAGDLIDQGKYWVFVATEKTSGHPVGFVSLYESYALYSEGAFGTIPELYVRPGWRSKNIGKQLLNCATEFSLQRGWRRLEVTTPPLPQFDSTLRFYQANGFTVSGGRKLKMDIGSS